MSSGRTAGAGMRGIGGAVIGARLLAGGGAGLVLVAGAVHAASATTPAHPHNWITAIVHCLLGERLVAYARRNPVGWAVLAMGVCGAAATGVAAWPDQRWVVWVGSWVWWPTYSLLPVVLLLFPTGRPPGRWWWAAVLVAGVGVVLPPVGIGWASWAEPATFWEGVFGGTARRGVAVALSAFGFAAFAVALVAAVASLVVRWHRARGSQRRVVRWALVGALVVVPALVLELASGAAWGAWLMAAAAFPVAVVIVIVRHGLYDIELVLHRTLLYGLLGASLIGGYTAIAVATTTAVPTGGNVLATVAVVAALAPLHRLLQGALNRWLFGDRADPYRALVELGRTLAHPLRPNELLPTLAAWVGRALKLPYVAVHLEGAESTPSAVHGRSCGGQRYQVELWHGGERTGVLVAEARARDERLTARERRLLEDMAGQAAPAAHAARLALALREADDRFERRRREDLHRISNDLHDTIGPSVVGIRKQVSAVLRAVDDADGRTRRRLADVVADLETLTDTVRRVSRHVQALDLRLGLVHAVCRQAERFDGEPAVRVVHAGRFDDIPPAVELAAFLVVSEALANVAHHAEAANCVIDLVRTPTWLRLVVTDDGRGMPERPTRGVGLVSMRERCQDLGGEFHVERASPGTRVTARIPLGPR
ncbi:sensor histidine kinase [Saccharothrix coeruleofusca]|nr:ATP-binding protein [Saccharothrix coeruleofusca]